MRVATPQSRQLPPIMAPVCGLEGFCQAVELCQGQGLGHIACVRHKYARGETLVQVGERLNSIYPIRIGAFKADAVGDKGNLQVMGFYFRGEIVGLDGIANGSYCSRVVALEDSEVCAISFVQLERACRLNAHLQRRFLGALAGEIAMQQNMMLVLGSMSAEQRLASFLLELRGRFQARGDAVAELHLSMTREDIGSYVGSTLETVSRVFSRFHERGLISVKGKHIGLLDIAALQRLAGQSERR